MSHFGERFRGGQYTAWWVSNLPSRCSTCPSICKSGGTVPDPLSGARPLGDGVGSGYLRDGSPSVWVRLRNDLYCVEWGVKLYSLTHSPPSVWSRGKKTLIWCPRSQVVVKMGARAPVPYGVSDTVSDILMVNPAGVIDVYYVSLYTRFY